MWMQHSPKVTSAYIFLHNCIIVCIYNCCCTIKNRSILDEKGLYLDDIFLSNFGPVAASEEFHFVIEVLQGAST